MNWLIIITMAIAEPFAIPVLEFDSKNECVDYVMDPENSDRQSPRYHDHWCGRYEAHTHAPQHPLDLRWRSSLQHDPAAPRPSNDCLNL